MPKQLINDDKKRKRRDMAIKFWRKRLVKTAMDIFDDMSQAEMIEDVNAERVARAYNELIRSLNGKKLKVDILGLPK